MPRTIRFHLDEHSPKAVAEGLRRRGIDTTMAAEVGLSGATDEQHLTWAATQVRVVFTQDDDFLRLHAAGVPHAGIAYCHQQSRSIGDIIRGLTLIWEICDPDDLKNKVEYL